MAERSRGEITETLAGSIMMQKMPPTDPHHREGRTAHLTARMDGAIIGNPNDMLTDAQKMIDEEEARHARLHPPKPEEPDYDFQSQLGDGPPIPVLDRK